MKTIDEVLNSEHIEYLLSSRYKISGNGVYIIMNSERVPIYIGYSTNFKKRMYDHYGRTGLLKFMPESHIIKFIFNIEREYEKVLIHHFRPKYNGKGLTCYTGIKSNFNLQLNL